MSRTGLAAAVPTLDLCRDMAAVPALAEAFVGSAVKWARVNRGPVRSRGWRLIMDSDRERYQSIRNYVIPAPLVALMLAWLRIHPVGAAWSIGGRIASFSLLQWSDLHDPDILARYCIKATRRPL